MHEQYRIYVRSVLVVWKNVCRTEASDGFIVRPKEDASSVEWCWENVEEIWMKIVPLYTNCPRTESGSSYWEATSIRVAKKQNKRSCLQNTPMFCYVCGAYFYFWRSNFSSADHTTSAFHQTMVPLTDPPLAVLLGTCCVGNWLSSRNRPDLRSCGIRVVLRDLLDYKCCD
jgi:hypothetical protein